MRRLIFTQWVVTGITAALLGGCIEGAGPDSPGPKGPGGPLDQTESPAEAYAGKVEVSWLNPLPRVNHIRDIDFPTSKVGYFVGQGGLFLSTSDGGLTLVDGRTGPQELNHVRFFDAKRGIVLGDNGFIMSTGDGGATWKTQNVGSSYFHGLCLHPSGRAFAVGDLGTVLKSTDFGETWVLKNSGRTEPLLDCQFLGPDTLYATRVGHLLKSVDGGQTWKSDTLFNRDGDPSDFHLHKLHLADSGGSYALNYGQPIQSTDGLRTWKSWSTSMFGWMAPQNIRDVSITGTGAAFLVGVGGAIFKGNVEPGSEWLPVREGTTRTLLAVDFPTADSGFAAGEFGEILHTSDSGSTWQALSSAGTREDLADVHFIDKYRGFAVGAAGTIIKTSDGGVTWNQVDGAASRALSGVHFLDGEVGCVVGEGGTALWTADSGKSWNLGGTGTQAYLKAVRVVGARTAYAGDGSHLIKTVDGGATWTPVSLPELGYAPGREIGDGLFYTGRDFFPSRPDLAFMSDDLVLATRQRSDSTWKNHAFTGRGGVLAGQSSKGGKVIHAVGGSTLFRIDAVEKTLHYHEIQVGQPLRAVHCLDLDACFAVGDKGVIVGFSMP